MWGWYSVVCLFGCCLLVAFVVCVNSVDYLILWFLCFVDCV